jgi:integrase
VTTALRRFTAWLTTRGEPLAGPGAITRALLERFLAHVGAEPGIGQPRRRSIIVDLKLFLDDIRLHGWAPGLASTATYHRGELPRETQPLPRYIDEFVMGQLEADENLARLPDQTTRTAVRLLIETGLRSVDALRLPFEPITRDQAGAPYLVFTNHKLAREAVIPISDRVLTEIRRQQAELRARWPAGPPPWLFPRPWQNADGHYPLGGGTLNRRLKRWLADCDIRDAHGQPARVTSHQFRHTVGTRLVNNKVPFEIVRRLLDHNSGAMTARYARIKDATLRREWERFQQRIDIRGEVIPLDPDGPLSDAAWAKENLARAKQTLPNGYCGLPLQQTCRTRTPA